MLSSCTFSEKTNVMASDLIFHTGFYFGGFYFYPRQRIGCPAPEGERVSWQA